MSKLEQNAQEEDTEVKANSVLGRIEPIKKMSDPSKDDTEKPKEEGLEKKFADNEKSLVVATRILLRQHGIRKSGAAVRDAVEMPHEEFMPQHAVSALSSLGFKASFGKLITSSGQVCEWISNE